MTIRKGLLKHTCLGSSCKICIQYYKFEAFNFHVINIDGNDFDQIDAAFKEARATKGMPTAIICKTVKGEGYLTAGSKSGRNSRHITLCNTTVNM